MSTQIFVGDFKGGKTTNKRPFFIDNDSFPVLTNAYEWRGRIKRKRGTTKLGRLTRYFDSTDTKYSDTSSFALVADDGNLTTGFSLESNANIKPGVTITDTTTTEAFTDPSEDGTLTGDMGGSGTINYANGDITITGAGAHSVSAVFSYYPDLPVMGLEEFNIDINTFPGTIGFDTKYSYNINTAYPYPITNVSYYKNPATDSALTNYTPKSTSTRFNWNGQDYQQFQTVNYEGALWVTNGITSPFSTTNVGMQYKKITGINIDHPTSPAQATLTIASHGLVNGDFVFINEVEGMTEINFQTGYVISADPQAANTVQVEFPSANLVNAYTTGGIAQYLTNSSDSSLDCIRWYDGNPNTSNGGWVNFCPPLSRSSFSIGNKKASQYYLVGCRMIVPFKDRLLFLAPVIQDSGGSKFYLPDTVVFSQNGTPYYTASYGDTEDDVSSSATVFLDVISPTGQTATSNAYFSDQTGYGGYISAGIDQDLMTYGSNEDVLILGFRAMQGKLIYTGNDIIPFNFYFINSEYGSVSTFSSVNLDTGVLTKGNRGYILTGQTQCTRFDTAIPDDVFEVDLTNNGNERFCSQRDFINEWIYFTYTSNQRNQEDASSQKFPNRTLLYNYRENTWANFDECYTHYGQWKGQTGFNWSTVGEIYPTWQAWNDPWNAGESTLLQPEVIAGNQQGYVMQRSEGTSEFPSLEISGISGSTVTSPNHQLNNGDFIIIKNAIGTGVDDINDTVFQVKNSDLNTFETIPLISGVTYSGLGEITRMYRPFIQTKQFPTAWGQSRKTRLGVQKYLFTKTDDAQVTVYIYLSQNNASPYNSGSIYPDEKSVNDSLIYSATVFTCPESTNLGLTPANINLQQVTALQQEEIWHRMNTSLLGDTVQLAITLSDEQMADVNQNYQFAEIELHAMILDIAPSGLLA